MARIKVDEVDRFGGGGNNEFFALKKDKESAVVRFLYEDEDDLDLFAVHEVMLNGKKRYVSCLDNGHCPLCESGNIVRVKLFLQLFVDGEVKTWERGKTFLPKILGYFDKYGPLVNRDYEVVRNGKPRSTDTTYELFPFDKEDITLEEFLDEEDVQKQELDGTFVLNWDEGQMEEFLDGGNPESSAEEEEEEQPRRRRSSRRNSNEDEGQDEEPRESRRSSRRSSRRKSEESDSEPSSRSSRGSRRRSAESDSDRVNRRNSNSDAEEVF